MSAPLNRRKARILVISFLAAAFAVALGFAVKGHREASALRARIDLGYRHAFAELTTAVSEMDVALQKASYASSPALLSSLCTELFGKAMGAQMALGELPYGNIQLEQTADFIARTGDYAMALSRKAATGNGCTEEERLTLLALAQASAVLSQQLCDLQADLYAGALTLDSLEEASARLSGGGQTLHSGDAFQAVEADFPEVPSLVYDGPFSQHLEGRTPKFLEGTQEVTCQEAAQAAGEFLGLDPQSLTFTSAGEGSIPTWDFSAQTADGEVYAEVSRAGGKVLTFLTSRFAGEEAFSAQEGVELAQSFLASHGYPHMRHSYYVNQNHTLTVNFAYCQDQVVCYSDLIKVEVALDVGRVTGFEATGYFMNHTDRSLPQPALSLAHAQLALDPSLKLLAHQLALIPTAGGEEILCLEFKCETGEGRHCLLYLNAQTGEQEKILLLLEDENGTLAL